MPVTGLTTIEVQLEQLRQALKEAEAIRDAQAAVHTDALKAFQKENPGDVYTLPETDAARDARIVMEEAGSRLQYLTGIASDLEREEERLEIQYRHEIYGPEVRAAGDKVIQAHNALLAAPQDEWRYRMQEFDQACQNLRTLQHLERGEPDPEFVALMDSMGPLGAHVDSIDMRSPKQKLDKEVSDTRQRRDAQIPFVDAARHELERQQSLSTVPGDVPHTDAGENAKVQFEYEEHILDGINHNLQNLEREQEKMEQAAPAGPGAKPGGGGPPQGGGLSGGSQAAPGGRQAGEPGGSGANTV